MTGLSTMGVIKATPLTPEYFHILINFLVLGVNFLFFFKLKKRWIKILMIWLKKVMEKTVDIIPAVVNRIVGPIPRPDPIPNAGPKKKRIALEV